jgi:hypothetical protein
VVEPPRICVEAVVSRAVRTQGGIRFRFEIGAEAYLILDGAIDGWHNYIDKLVVTLVEDTASYLMHGVHVGAAKPIDNEDVRRFIVDMTIRDINRINQPDLKLDLRMWPNG